MNKAQLISTADAIDPVFIFIFGACLFLLIGITATMLYFVIRYHRSRAPEATSRVEGNLWLEIVWIVLPTLLVLAMFFYGWKEYLVLRTVPKDALTVTATARMWSWKFTYENGKSSSKLYVPVNRPVKVELQSQDVIHGFFIPAFRIKRDMVPGMNNYSWFVANRQGSYDIFCSQYCGTNHSSMITTVEALPEKEFTAWLQQGGNGSDKLIDARKLAEEKGCLGCHSLDGTTGVGPTFKGILGRQEKVTRNGTLQTISVDAVYIRESITMPAAAVVEGFQPIMPEFNDLSKEELEALVTFVAGVK